MIISVSLGNFEEVKKKKEKEEARQLLLAGGHLNNCKLMYLFFFIFLFFGGIYGKEAKKPVKKHSLFRCPYNLHKEVNVFDFISTKEEILLNLNL